MKTSLLLMAVSQQSPWRRPDARAEVGGRSADGSAGQDRRDVWMRQPWQKAARLTPFVHHDTMAAARVKRKCASGTTRRRCISGWICEDGDIQATFTQRDSRFWEEEVVEFFVTPSTARPLFRAAVESARRHVRRHHHERARPGWPLAAVQGRLVVHRADDDLRRPGGRFGAELERSRHGAGRSKRASRSPI